MKRKEYKLFFIAVFSGGVKSPAKKKKLPLKKISLKINGINKSLVAFRLIAPFEIAAVVHKKMRGEIITAMN